MTRIPRIDEIVLHEGEDWRVVQIYRNTRTMLIEREGIRREVDLPKSTTQRELICPCCKQRPRLVRPNSLAAYCRECERDIGRENRRPVAEEVECRICAKSFRTLGPHLRVHSLTSADYRRLYPGAPLTSTAFREIHVDLWVDRFGQPRWTRDKILIAIQRWTRRAGRPPAAGDWRKGTQTHPSDQHVIKVFGSWNAALRSAGCETRPQGRPPRWTTEQVIEAIQRFVDEFGRQPTTRELADPGTRPAWCPSRDVLMHLFGSFGAAIEAAGFSPYPQGGRPGIGLGRKHKICRNGHALDGENVYINSDGSRRCRTCRRASHREASRRYRSRQNDARKAA